MQSVVHRPGLQLRRPRQGRPRDRKRTESTSHCSSSRHQHTVLIWKCSGKSRSGDSPNQQRRIGSLGRGGGGRDTSYSHGPAATPMNGKHLHRNMATVVSGAHLGPFRPPDPCLDARAAAQRQRTRTQSSRQRGRQKLACPRAGHTQMTTRPCLQESSTGGSLLDFLAAAAAAALPGIRKGLESQMGGRHAEGGQMRERHLDSSARDDAHLSSRQKPALSRMALQGGLAVLGRTRGMSRTA